VDCGATVNVTMLGSPEVKPQESKSYTAGFVFEPARNASISVDYWKIKRKNDYPYSWLDWQFIVDHRPPRPR
jgi:outer membrane receptor protein involved in Fe transport